MFGGEAEQSIQSVSSDLAIYVQFPIELVKCGQKGRHILHFSPHFSQLENTKKQIIPPMQESSLVLSILQEAETEM